MEQRTADKSQNITPNDVNKTLDGILEANDKTTTQPQQQEDSNNTLGLNNEQSEETANSNKNTAATTTSNKVAEESNDLNNTQQDTQKNTSNTSNTGNITNVNSVNNSNNSGRKRNNTRQNRKMTEENELEADLKEYEKIMDKGLTRKIGNTISGLGNSIKNSVDEAASGLRNTLASEQTQGIMWKILLLLMILSLALILYFGCVYIYNIYINKNKVVELLAGTKNAKHSMVISQNPDNTNYIAIERSNDKDGIEFSYTFWFLMDDMTYKNGEWKHIMHKGSANGYPNRCPGVWIHPNRNAIRIYLNTYSKILEFIDIDNLPIRKWIHVAITVHNKELLTYINGYIKSKKTLDSLPRQNDGDLWINLYGGFSGYVSKMLYTPYKMSFDAVNSYMREGVYGGACIDTNEIPPYMADAWWQQETTDK